MVDLSGKKLLIIGGSRLSIEIVNAARKRGIYTIVTDWYSYEQSPAKQVADKYYIVDNQDYASLLKIIEDEKIEGILTGYTDSTLPYYAELCEKSGLPCYGSKELFDLYIDKSKYKPILRDYEIPVVEEYSLTYDDLVANQALNLKYPLLVKPSDNSGGKGVSICRDYHKLLEGYQVALEHSKSKTVLVERFIEGEEVTLFFLFNHGEVYLSGIANRHIKKNQGEDTIALPVGYTFPSYVIPSYLAKTFPKMTQMLQDNGIKDGMMFAQCLIEDNDVIIYDIGYRLTGSLEYKLQEEICGYNPLDMMIHFAFTGEMFADGNQAVITPYWDNYAYNISYLIETEKEIGQIIGLDELVNYPGVIDATLAHVPGDKLPASAKGTLAQIVLRGFGVADSIEALKKSLKDAYALIEVKDTLGNNILLAGLDETEINEKLVKLNDN